MAAGFTPDPDEEEEQPVGASEVAVRPRADQTGREPEGEPPPTWGAEPTVRIQTAVEPQEPPVEEPPAWLEEPEWEPEPEPTPGSPVQVVAQGAILPLGGSAPLVVVQATPAAPASSQDFPWERFVAEAGRSLGQGIQALLKQASPLEWNSGRLEVQCSNSITFVRRKEELESLASGLTGMPVKLQFQEGQQNAGNSIGNREREAQRQHLAELEQQALAHPLVQEVLTRFPGALVQEIIIEEKENDV